MKITMIGTGYVGLTTGTCLADLGHDVTCLDIDKKKIDNLNSGKIPIYEPGLSDLVKRGVKEKRLFFTTDTKSAVESAQVIFIAVGTPSKENGDVDLTYVESAAATIGKFINKYKVVVDKSTVPVGTGDMVAEIIRRTISAENKGNEKKLEFDVVSNPEFLREGRAIKDFMNPDRIVIGVTSTKAKDLMLSIYKGLERPDKPILFTDIRSAEMIKYAANAFLATKISFINEIARLCEKEGADVKMVSRGIGLDERIGPKFLSAGIGYGGSCFPKDVKGLISTGKSRGVDFKILKAAEAVNVEQREIMIEKIKSVIPKVKGKKIACWGLSFKPNTDDMREAPSVTVIKRLLREGAEIVAFDPVAKEQAEKELVTTTGSKPVVFAETPYDALDGADCLVIFTEWDEFRNLDKNKMKELLKSPIIIDGRNIYNPDEMKELGFTYISFGRQDIRME